MARGRMIDKRISKSKKLPRVKGDSAKVLYFIIYPHLDRDGMIAFDDLDDLKIEIMPYFFDYPIKQIANDLNALADVGLIHVFPYEEKIAIKFVRFEDFQSFAYNRESASVVKVVPDNSGEYRITQEDSGVLLILPPKIKYKIKSNEGMKEKERKENSRSCENPKCKNIKHWECQFNQFWKNYPNSIGKQDTRSLFISLCKKGELEDLIRGFNGYLEMLAHKRIHDNFEQSPMNSARFLRKENWKEFIGFKCRPKL